MLLILKKKWGGENLIFELNEGINLAWVNLKVDPDKKDSAELMFQSRQSLEADVSALRDVPIGASQILYLRTEDVDEQYDRLKNKVKVLQIPVTKPYGMREWYLKDLNGYILCFGQELG